LDGNLARCTKPIIAAMVSPGRLLCIASDSQKAPIFEPDNNRHLIMSGEIFIDNQRTYTTLPAAAAAAKIFW
jgi:hypothetical protein